MTAIVTRGDAARLLLPDHTVDLVVTSPPYHQLRAYQDGGEAYFGQIGAEATPEAYLDALIACTREWLRVLRPSGSLFVNLGDAYSNKGLRGLPWRYAIRCIDELGLILRAEIVWAKPNGLPESVTDRVRRSHEQVFHFVKQPRYYSAVDSIRECYGERHGGGRSLSAVTASQAMRNSPLQQTGLDSSERNALGKLPGSVWTIATSPLKVPDHLGVDHFAAYPPGLVRRIVLGWSPRELCTACGEGRRPVVDARPDNRVPYITQGVGSRPQDGARRPKVLAPGGGALPSKVKTLSGYACACPDTDAPTTPGVCLDPFGGTGTTALVASSYGRVGISVDLSADYCRLARWRTSDPGERARVLGVEKPPVQVDGQLGMFEGMGA